MEAGSADRIVAMANEYAVAVHRYLLRRLAGAPDAQGQAEDLTSEVFLVAWRRRDDVPVDAELPWLYAVARRLLANHRRRPADIAVDDLGSLEGIDEADPADIVTRDAALAAAWRQLSSRDREILRLSVWEGLSGDDLAAALGISAGGAAAALSRARARLVEQISAHDVKEAVAP